GMARAFFYAGARTLLVSHWEVGSDAAVKLVTRAFAELKSTPRIGRAEALRNSMRDLIERGTPAKAHPSQWAPFVVVGEGSGGVRGAGGGAPPAVVGGQKGPAPKAARTRAPKRVTVPDWRKEVWRQYPPDLGRTSAQRPQARPPPISSMWPQL